VPGKPPASISLKRRQLTVAVFFVDILPALRGDPIHPAAEGNRAPYTPPGLKSVALVSFPENNEHFMHSHHVSVVIAIAVKHNGYSDPGRQSFFKIIHSFLLLEPGKLPAV
jgi:hypothetical protein